MHDCGLVPGLKNKKERKAIKAVPGTVAKCEYGL